MPLLLEEERRVDSARSAEPDLEACWQFEASSIAQGRRLTAAWRVPALARLGGVVVVIYLLLTFLGQMPGDAPQEDLPEKNPLEAVQMMRSYDASQVTSGTVVIFDR